MRTELSLVVGALLLSSQVVSAASSIESGSPSVKLFREVAQKDRRIMNAMKKANMNGEGE
jgi:hypothetical protein